MFLELNDIYQREACDVIVHRMNNPDRIKLILQPTWKRDSIDPDDRIRMVFSHEQVREIVYQLSQEVQGD